jgi:hypothetical protein
MHLAVPRPDGLVNFVSSIRGKISHLAYQHCRHQVEKQRRKLIQSMLLDRTACVDVSESLVSDVQAYTYATPSLGITELGKDLRDRHFITHHPHDSENSNESEYVHD